MFSSKSYANKRKLKSSTDTQQRTTTHHRTVKKQNTHQQQPKWTNSRFQQNPIVSSH